MFLENGKILLLRGIRDIIRIMTNKKTKTALLFIILASIFGGSVPVASKYGLEVFKPFTMWFYVSL